MKKTLIAHRGMSSLAPENTLAAFSLCKEHGVKWFECDVDILQDGTVIISHDDTLDRCTDKSGRLCDITRDDLSNIDAGSWFGDIFTGERIPTLQQMICLANDKQLNLNIEIKSCAASAKLSRLLIDNLITALKDLNPERELIISSFNHLVLSEFKQLSPQTPVACLFESHNLLDDWNATIEWCQADYIHPEDKGLTREMVNKFKDAGIKVNVWTVNDLARANELFNWGVDGICTDIAHQFPSKYRL
ncbi:glycerophosphoryl diester phosphodiesterase [Psychromonas ossibalaenae]|uniref:glycerophosphoryl diester phosphodiesterase n=1 Tax=Psychromonas ossibalaenae TaxID=444922 RepID=UPI00035D1A62|nr:glycerophosphoryl diester phosphodiesterase [Psychromonas ossibalaenae]